MVKHIRNLTTEDISVVGLFEDGNLIGIIHKDMKFRKNIMAKTEDMDFEEMKVILNRGIIEDSMKTIEESVV